MWKFLTKVLAIVLQFCPVSWWHGDLAFHFSVGLDARKSGCFSLIPFASLVLFLDSWVSPAVLWIWELHFKPGNFLDHSYCILVMSLHPQSRKSNVWQMQGYLNPWVWRCAYAAISVSLGMECDSCFLTTRSHRMSPSPILSSLQIVIYLT